MLGCSGVLRNPFGDGGAFSKRGLEKIMQVCRSGREFRFLSRRQALPAVPGQRRSSPTGSWRSDAVPPPAEPTPQNREDNSFLHPLCPISVILGQNPSEVRTLSGQAGRCRDRCRWQSPDPGALPPRFVTYIQMCHGVIILTKLGSRSS